MRYCSIVAIIFHRNIYHLESAVMRWYMLMTWGLSRMERIFEWGSPVYLTSLHFWSNASGDDDIRFWGRWLWGKRRRKRKGWKLVFTDEVKQLVNILPLWVLSRKHGRCICILKNSDKHSNIFFKLKASKVLSTFPVFVFLSWLMVL